MSIGYTLSDVDCLDVGRAVAEWRARHAAVIGKGYKMTRVDFNRIFLAAWSSWKTQMEAELDVHRANAITTGASAPTEARGGRQLCC